MAENPTSPFCARQLRTAHAQLEEYSATLEDRVAQRTNELSIKNEMLSPSLHDLNSAQHQLVQTEKMASLGSIPPALLT